MAFSVSFICLSLNYSQRFFFEYDALLIPELSVHGKNVRKRISHYAFLTEKRTLHIGISKWIS